MKKPLLILAIACVVALSSIICGNLCGHTSAESANISSETANR